MIIKIPFNVESYSIVTQSRSPGIYKQQYLDDLCQRYDTSEKFPVPELPEWCLDEDEGESDNEGQVNGAIAEDGSRPDGSRKRMRREYKTAVS